VNVDLFLPLELLSAGEWADVMDVTGEPAWVARMAELGIQPGSRVRVIQSGNPCLLQVGGSRLSLRADQAMQILVRPLPMTLLANRPSLAPALEKVS
jgi:ferrous iron transport protein A